MLFGLMAAGCATVHRPPPGASATPAAVQADRECPAIVEPRKTPAIRSNDAFVRSLLSKGCQQSPTLRALVDAIGRTDGVVYITTGACPIRALRGCLMHTIEDTGSARYLWIRMNAHGRPSTLVSTMAHELQHALEVLERTDIRSQRDMIDFYQSVASGSLGGVNVTTMARAYETRAAIDVGNTVRAEVMNASGVVSTNDRH